MWRPCPRKNGLRGSPLTDGTHDMVRALPLVEPCVVAVPHQLIRFCLMAPHVLVEVAKVHVGKLLQTQHSCAGYAHQCLPGPCGASTAAGSTSLPTPKVAAAPGLRHWGAMRTCPHLDSGQMNLVSVTSGPEGRPREVCFLFKP